VFDKNKKLKGANKAVKEELVSEKMASKDHDGDGKVESGKDEYFGSRDKAIKKAMAKKKGMKKEHHEKDADGKVIEHEDTTPVSVEEGSLKQARKNIGRDPDKPSCWKGYKAKGTKMKGGKSVPNCVKEDEIMEQEKCDTGNVYQKKKKGEKTMKYADGVNEELRDHLDELRARYRERIEKMYEGYGKKKKKMGYK